MEINKMNPSGTETGILRESQVHTMAAIVLAPCFTKSSAAMSVILQDWYTLEWCQLNALQASPVMHLVTPLSCVSVSRDTRPSVPAILTGPCIPSWRISIICTISMYRNYRKCMCVYIYIVYEIYSRQKKFEITKWLTHVENKSQAVSK